MRFKGLFILTIGALFLAQFTLAAVEELINSYSYDFYNGTINITGQNDNMADKDGNGKNDTLIINLTTEAISGKFNFIVEIMDESGILVNSSEKMLSVSDSTASVNFPSELLAKDKFNYSIRIFDNDDNLVFRKSNIESQIYKNYEAGTNITKITDENINNNFIRLNLTIDSSQAITTNVTVTLAYNSSTISKTEEKTLSSGIQKVSIDFDNETIKSTHYYGNFTIEAVAAGNRIFTPNQNTSAYNYEDFARTSYIKSITDGKINSGSANLSEFLEINFTLEIKESGSYSINYDLYDQFGNFVINGSKRESLSTGMQLMNTLINGSEIYKAKINGPYVLSSVKLSISNETKDIIFNAHTTDQNYYTDYKKPNLPDLIATISKVFDDKSNLTNISVNLSNIGNAPAFNIFLDIFDNETFIGNETLYFLDRNNFKIYVFNATNASNAALFTAIADFDNRVDESDETNNIASTLEVKSNDLDNDGIDDSIDTLIGDVASVNTTIDNITIRIGNLTDLSRAFNGTWKISFEGDGAKLMEFDFNLSNVLNLSNLLVEKQKNSSFGYTVVRGLSLKGKTKALYVDRVDSTVNGACIKDAEIASVSEISGNCDGLNEEKIECDGTLQGRYVCSYNLTAGNYRISGLNNSGIKQIDFGKPSAPASSTASGGGSGSGSGGSGSCLENWQCVEWSECADNLRTRSCTDKGNCGTIFNKPSETKLCTLIRKSALNPAEKEFENYNVKLRKNKKYSLPDITGYLLKPQENANPTVGAYIMLFVIVSGLLGYFYFINRP